MRAITRPLALAVALGALATPAAGQAPLCIDVAAAVAEARTEFRAWRVPGATSSGTPPREASTRTLAGASVCTLATTPVGTEYQCDWVAAAGSTATLPDVAQVQECYPGLRPDVELMAGHRPDAPLRPSRAVFHHSNGITITLRQLWHTVSDQLARSELVVSTKQ